jgi:hypothetical protein
MWSVQVTGILMVLNPAAFTALIRVWLGAGFPQLVTSGSPSNELPRFQPGAISLMTSVGDAPHAPPSPPPPPLELLLEPPPLLELLLEPPPLLELLLEPPLLLDPLTPDDEPPPLLDDPPLLLDDPPLDDDATPPLEEPLLDDDATPPLEEPLLDDDAPLPLDDAPPEEDALASGVGLDWLSSELQAGSSNPKPMAHGQGDKSRWTTRCVVCFRCMRFSLEWTYDRSLRSLAVTDDRPNGSPARSATRLSPLRLLGGAGREHRGVAQTRSMRPCLRPAAPCSSRVQRVAKRYGTARILQLYGASIMSGGFFRPRPPRSRCSDPLRGARLKVRRSRRSCSLYN